MGIIINLNGIVIFGENIYPQLNAEALISYPKSKNTGYFEKPYLENFEKISRILAVLDKFATENCYGFSVCYFCYLNYITFRLPRDTINLKLHGMSR